MQVSRGLVFGELILDSRGLYFILSGGPVAAAAYTQSYIIARLKGAQHVGFHVA